MPTAIPRPNRQSSGMMPSIDNLPDLQPEIDAASGITPKTAVNPAAVFGAYANSRLGGARTRTKFGQGTRITSGPMRGQQMGAAREQMRQDLANAPDSVKQAMQDRATGADIMPGYKKPGADTGGGQTAPRLDTYGMGGKVEYKGLDYLSANRTTGSALDQMERNVGATGDRNRAPKTAVRPPQAVPQATPAVPKAASPVGMVGQAATQAATAIQQAPQPVTAQAAAYDYNRGGYPVAGTNNVSSAPQSGDPVRDAAAKWAHDLGTPRAKTAVKPPAAVAGTPATPLRGMTGLGKPMEDTRGMEGLGQPSTAPAPAGPINTAPVALPANATAVKPPSSMDILDKSLGQGDAAKRAFLAKASMPAPDAAATDELVADQKARNNDALRAKNPGAKASLIPGYASDAAKGNERMVTAGDILKSTRR